VLGDSKPLIFISVAGSVGAGALLWLLLGHLTVDGRLVYLKAELPLRSLSGPPPTDQSRTLTTLKSSPIFGPGLPDLPTIRLDGLSRTPMRSAALVAINNKPAEWLAAGTTRDGVTLIEVQPSRAVVETFDGQQAIDLGQTAPAPSKPSSSGADNTIQNQLSSRSHQPTK
jgi:hypothetical protein